MKPPLNVQRTDMKYLLCIAVLVLSAAQVGYAQSGNVGIGTTTPDPSSKLDITSDTSGILIPRMTDVQRNGILNPATGLMVFVTTDSAFYYFDGTAWVTFHHRTARLTDSDQDTKIQVEAFPDEDRIRFDVAGSEAMTIDLNGNVGIGTTSPDGILQVVSSGPQTEVLINNTGTGDPVLGFQLSGASQYKMGIDDNDSDKFKIAMSDTLGVNDIVTINSAGNVGIGEGNPSAKLHVNGTIQVGNNFSYDKIRLYPASFYSLGFNEAQTLGFLNSFAMTFSMYDHPSYGWLWRSHTDASSDGAMSLTSDGRLYVKSTASFNGNVGIGTTTPTQKLSVIGNAEMYGFLNTTSGIRTGSFGSPGSWGIYVTGTGYLSDFLRVDGGIHVGGSSDPGTDNLIVDGNVGIGTTVPSQRLDVIGNAEISGYLATLGGIHVGGYSPPGTDNLIVDGNVGIGTTSPSQKLDVIGNAEISGYLTTLGGIHVGGTSAPGTDDLIVDGTAKIGSGATQGGLLDVIGDGGVQGNMVINRVSTDGVLIRFRRDGTTQGSIDVSGSVVSYNAFTGSHYAWTDEILEPGTLVAMTGQNKHCGGDPPGEIIYGISASTFPNSPAILGAYLAPEIAGDADDGRPHLVMSVGNGAMWVADMGENIEIGDYLISSAVPGHAMKDHGDFEISYIIARAAEPIDWDLINETMHGVKRKKISVLFENFTRNHTSEKVLAELERTHAELQVLRIELERLRETMTSGNPR